jgi:hypothetical protein
MILAFRYEQHYRGSAEWGRGIRHESVETLRDDPSVPDGDYLILEGAKKEAEISPEYQDAPPFSSGFTTRRVIRLRTGTAKTKLQAV